jgi:hypothetical protein
MYKHEDTQLKLGKKYKYYGHYKKAREWLYKSAFQGNTDAMIELGDITTSLDERYEWYKKSSDLGNSDAMNLMGGYHFDKESKEYNLKKSFDYYEQSIKLGNKRPIAQLGYMHIRGYGVRKDYKKGFDVLKINLNCFTCKSYMHTLLKTKSISNFIDSQEIYDVCKNFVTAKELKRILEYPSSQSKEEFNMMNCVLDNKYTCSQTVKTFLQMKEEYIRQKTFNTMYNHFVKDKHIPKDILNLITSYLS